MLEDGGHALVAKAASAQVGGRLWGLTPGPVAEFPHSIPLCRSSLLCSPHPLVCPVALSQISNEEAVSS